jgi:RNA polymerase sigma-70 factor (ECF subfamily)
MALMQKKIENALARISEREKAVFLLRHYHDLNLKEIAVALGISLGSVKSYLFRSIKKIQKELGVSQTPLEPGG